MDFMAFVAIVTVKALYNDDLDGYYGSAEKYALGCVNSPSVARGSQEAGFTQPRVHLLADPCMDQFFHFFRKTTI